MKACYMTDAGRVRSHNEDSVTILKNASDEYLENTQMRLG